MSFVQRCGRVTGAGAVSGEGGVVVPRHAGRRDDRANASRIVAVRVEG